MIIVVDNVKNKLSTLKRFKYRITEKLKLTKYSGIPIVLIRNELEI